MINTFPIKKFIITKLFGFQDVAIPFDQPVKILIAENGTGKTSILNIIYYALTLQFQKLKAFEFENIIVEFTSGKEVSILRQDIDLLRKSNRGFIRHLTDIITPLEVEELVLLVKNREELVNSKLFEKIKYRIKVPTSILIREIEDWVNVVPEAALDFEKSIRKELSSQILYFPTYRRIEEDLKNLGYGDTEIDKADSKLIQFGMNDVSSRFEKVTSTIRNSAVAGLAQVTGEMISQLLDGITVSKEMHEAIQNPEALKIVLDRVGDNLSRYKKSDMQDLIKSPEFLSNPTYYPLIYFLSNLIKVYEKEKGRESKIKKFVNICNSYLVNTRIIYNESEVKISVIRQSNEQPIQLSKLSSGEKQIISLFSIIYLGSAEKFIIIFDEPELSLSIDWQKKLLPDIMESGNCEFLISATHSPFIFDNELDGYATNLHEYILKRM